MKIKALFLDVGGVFLTNGWDHNSRKLACKTFKLDFDAIEALHHNTFDLLERGKITFDVYLKRVFFTQKRKFTLAMIKKFVFAQSKAYQEMIDLIIYLKAKHQLKTVVVSNEGREINDFRIKKFKMRSFIDFFISSCFIHLLKPDFDMYKMALDTAQVEPEEVIYIDNIQMYVDAAAHFGINTICHQDYESTREALKKYGLK